MRDLVEYIVKQIVTTPDDVVVSEDYQDSAVVLTLKVNPVDMGIVIGKGGQTIKAIRKVLTVRAMHDNVRVSLQLLDQLPPVQENSEDSSSKETPHEN